MSTIKTKKDTRSTMPERTAGLRKPQVLLAGAFAGRLLPTIRQRFAVQAFGNEFIDLSKIDFTNVSSRRLLRIWLSNSETTLK